MAFKPGNIPGGRVGGHIERTGPPKLKPRQSPQTEPALEQVAMGAPPAPVRDFKLEAPTQRLPAGWVWLWNRLNRQWEWQFDGIPQVFEPFEFRPVTEEIAGCLYAHSIISYSDDGGVVRCLAVEGDEGWCVPLEDPTNVELIDRTTDDNPIGWGTGGEETKAVAIKVPGAKPELHAGRGLGNLGRAGNTSATFRPAVRKGTRSAE